jgi:hypothetical protein
MVLVEAWEMAGGWGRGIDITIWKTGRIFNLGLENGDVLVYDLTRIRLVV